MVVVRMSAIANAILSLAQSVADSTGSGLAIRITKNDRVKLEFVSKDGTDELVWEDHYPDVAFYLGNSANPVRWDIDVTDYRDETVVNAIDNAVSTKYYRTFMQNEALSNVFNISGPQQDLIIRLLYFTLGGIGILAMIMLAIYGGA